MIDTQTEKDAECWRSMKQEMYIATISPTPEAERSVAEVIFYAMNAKEMEIDKHYRRS